MFAVTFTFQIRTGDREAVEGIGCLCASKLCFGAQVSAPEQCIRAPLPFLFLTERVKPETRVSIPRSSIHIFISSEFSPSC